jgi:uncharacterized repeat protein (TIGR03803 family)
MKTANITGHIAQAAILALVLAVVLVLTAAITQPAQAQTYSVIHNFTGGQDGANPEAGLTLDKAGNLYGTAAGGGAGNGGTVFSLAHKGSGWFMNPLYSFQGGSDGDFPMARVIFGPDGNLYGTTFLGGVEGCDNGQGCGTVFNLRPQPTACKTALCPWTETVLYRFTQGDDGGDPFGEVVFDKAGNIYGTAYNGGVVGNGVVYELVPSNGGWTETVLYSFAGGSDGEGPQAPVIFDTEGNLYGTTIFGGSGNNGTVFQLTPSASGWTEKVLYRFQNGSDGHKPLGRSVFDRLGNLYGTTENGGAGNGGTVVELTPLDGNWTYNLVYSFAGSGGSDDLVMDAAGNLYGTTYSDGAYGWGSAFKLTPSNGGWTYTSLHDFTGGNDGGNPIGGLVFDANGNLYGTTYGGGKYRAGLVFEITPGAPPKPPLLGWEFLEEQLTR